MSINSGRYISPTFIKLTLFFRFGVIPATCLNSAYQEVYDPNDGN